MGVKETIVEALRNAGCDMLTACEEADRVIREFLASGRDRTVYVVRGTGAVLCLQRKERR